MFTRLVGSLHEKRNPAIWIILVYVVVTGSWILFSDELVAHFITSPEFGHISTLKGWLFSLITAIILYKLIDNSFSEIVTSRQQLAISEKQMHLIIDTVPALVSYVDAKGRYSWVNKGYESLLGMSGETICGRHIREIHGEAAWVKMKPFVVRTLSGEKVTYENSIPTTGGELITFSAVYSPDHDNEGHVRGFVALVQDITQQKQNELALITYNRRLIEFEDEVRRQLAAELHDEFGPDLTALNFMLSLADVCPIRVTECPFSTKVHNAEHLVAGLSRKVRAIIARLRPPVLEDYGLEAALRWHLERLAQLTDITLLMHTDGPVPRLPVDQELALFRITYEALSNAVKHSQARQVTMTLSCTDTIFRIEVRDDGVGFVPPVEAPAGTIGWGLAIMRERAELLGAKFILDPGPDFGVRMLLEIAREGTDGH